MGVWYCTREDVKSALDIMMTARSDAQVDGAIESATKVINNLTHRRFYPWTGTRYFPYPDTQNSPYYRVYLEENDIISVTTLTSDGEVITSDDYFLEPANDGPPYTQLELNRGTGATFTTGSTSQRTIAITGVFGYNAEETPGGSLAEPLDSSETSVDVTDSASVGVGSIIRVDSERMIVMGKSSLTTGLTMITSLTAMNNAELFTVSGTGAVIPGETLLLDAERVLVVDVVGSNVIVKRAYDGSTLAAHTAPVSIYAPRTLTVQRGALGTTAATHLDAAPINVHVVPGAVRELAVGEALNTLLQRQSGYARTAGTGENQREGTGRGLKDLREQVYDAFGRKARKYVI